MVWLKSTAAAGQAHAASAKACAGCVTWSSEPGLITLKPARLVTGAWKSWSTDATAWELSSLRRSPSCTRLQGRLPGGATCCTYSKDGHRGYAQQELQVW